MVRVKRVCVYVTRARFARHAMNFRVMKVKWKFPVITAILSNGPNRGAILRRLNSHAPPNVYFTMRTFNFKIPLNDTETLNLI